MEFEFRCRQTWNCLQRQYRWKVLCTGGLPLSLVWAAINRQRQRTNPVKIIALTVLRLLGIRLIALLLLFPSLTRWLYCLSFAFIPFNCLSSFYFWHFSSHWHTLVVLPSAPQCVCVCLHLTFLTTTSLTVSQVHQRFVRCHFWILLIRLASMKICWSIAICML